MTRAKPVERSAAARRGWVTRRRRLARELEDAYRLAEEAEAARLAMDRSASARRGWVARRERLARELAAREAEDAYRLAEEAEAARLAWEGRWDAVRAWALETVERLGDLDTVEEEALSDRATGVQARVVPAIKSAVQAFELAVPMSEVLDWLEPVAPTEETGGHRRVCIDCFTWAIDEIEGVAYAPDWISLGTGMTAHAARAAARRWIREYMDDVEKGYASRLIRATALGVVWWTAAPEAGYL